MNSKVVTILMALTATIALGIGLKYKLEYVTIIASIGVFYVTFIRK